MSLRALLFLLILAIPWPAAAQTTNIDPFVSKGEGGENADAFHAAKERAEALEAEGAWAEAVDQWEKAFSAVERALFNAEFGTTPQTMGFPPNQFTLQMPKGFHHRGEVRDRAAQAAHRAGEGAAAMRWADNDLETITAFEAEARSAGRTELADVYRVALLGQELAALEAKLANHERRTAARLTLMGVYSFMLVIIAGVLVWRYRARPRFTFLNPARHPRSPREPPLDWRAPVAEAAGGVFGLVVVAWLLISTWHNATRASGVVLLAVSVLATGVVLWVFSIALSRAMRRSARALDELDPIKTDALSELHAWFEANAFELCSDFGIGVFSRARLDRTVPAISDPLLRSALAGWLGGQLARRSSDIPAWLDEHVRANLDVYPAGAWEPLVAPYAQALRAPRRAALLEDVPAGAAPIFGGDVREPEHTGPIARWLELAMVCGSRWPADEWARRFADPVLTEIVSSVVWGAFARGELLRSFRLDAEGGLLSLGYESLHARALRGFEIGVAHVTDLDPGDRIAWEQELADFEAVALFDQLGRPCVDLEWEEKGARLVVDVRLAEGGYERLLDRGWERCAVGLQRGVRPFGVTAQAHIDHARMRCSGVTFLIGYITTYQSGTNAEADAMSPVLVTEVLYELMQAAE